MTNFKQASWKPGFQRVTSKISKFTRHLTVAIATIMLINGTQARNLVSSTDGLKIEMPALRANTSVNLPAGFQAVTLSIDMNQAFQDKHPNAVFSALLTNGGTSLIVNIDNISGDEDIEVATLVLESASGGAPEIATVHLKDGGVEIVIADY